MNAAHALGLGSCWINRAKQTFEREDGKQMLKDWGVEGDYEGIGFCILGYAAKEGKTLSRKQKSYLLCEVRDLNQCYLINIGCSVLRHSLERMSFLHSDFIL